MESVVVFTVRVRERIERYLPQSGSNRGYEPSKYIELLLMMLHEGGRYIEDLRKIRDDRALRELAGMEERPSSSTFGDWLMRVGAGGEVEGMVWLG